MSVILSFYMVGEQDIFAQLWTLYQGISYCFSVFFKVDEQIHLKQSDSGRKQTKG